MTPRHVTFAQPRNITHDSNIPMLGQCGMISLERIVIQHINIFR